VAFVISTLTVRQYDQMLHSRISGILAFPVAKKNPPQPRGVKVVPRFESQRAHPP